MRIHVLMLGAAVVLAHTGFFSCDDHHDDFNVFDDVAVDVTGTAGLDFDARFEDDRRAQTATGVVPFSADFTDQVNFFRAVVDKNSTGMGEICVKVTSTHDSRQECSNAPSAQVSVTVFF